jgi:hypothetical protein
MYGISSHLYFEYGCQSIHVFYVRCLVDRYLCNAINTFLCRLIKQRLVVVIRFEGV